MAERGVTINGEAGDNLKYKLVDGTMTISGTGEMWNKSIAPGGGNNFKTLIKSLIIEPGVTSIGNMAFSWYSNLEEVTLPEGITKIGSNAFGWCTNLKSIIIPESVTEIIGNPFMGCSDKLAITVYRNSAGEEFVKKQNLNYNVICGTSHDWGDWEIEQDSTCEKTGLQKRYCMAENCEAFEETEISLKPHDWNMEYTVDKEATCTQDGEKSKYCKNCPAKNEESIISIPAKGHLWDEGVITKAPTCTEPGIRTCTCERCKWTLRKEVAPIGHTYAGEITKATFTKDGAVSGVCEDCGASVQREVIPQVSKVELSHTEYTYNGTNRQPKVVLKDRNGKELKQEAYSVAYPKESKVPGTYELTITLKGNYYEGTLTKAYTVKKGNQVIGLSDMTKRIDSKTVTLKAEILQGNKTGRFGYKSSNPEVASVTSWGRVTFHKVGKVEITAMTRGSANYNSAQKTITLTVAPVPTAVTKLQSQNPGWLNIQYRANPEADGYQMQYGTPPDMKGAKYAAVENAAIRSYTRTDVKSGETYYVRVRTYNVVDGERIYSNWSGIKSVEVK